MKRDNNSAISRRDFITKLWGVVVAAPFLYGALKFIAPQQKKFVTASQKTSTGNVSSVIFTTDSLPVNSSKLVNIEGEPVIVVRRSENEIVALSAVCTHLNCVVEYRNESKDIFCACHGGRYNLDGNVIDGPPKSPLSKYKIKLENNKITVSRIS